MSTTPRVIVARYDSRCWDCRNPINAGDTVSFLPADPEAGRPKGRTSHLDCVQQGPRPPMRRSISPYVTPDEPLREVERHIERQMQMQREREMQRPAAPPPPPPAPRPRTDNGFPVNRPSRARHLTEQMSQPTQAAQPLVPGTPRERAKAYADNPDCELCKRGGPGPSHNGSPNCRSGSPASGGRHAHCACDTCF